VDGDADNDNRLDVGETWTYVAVHEVTQDDLDAGEIINTASVDSAESDAATAMATVDVIQIPIVAIGLELEIVSAFDGLAEPYENSTFIYAAGDQVVHTITVVNLGNSSLTGVVTFAASADSPPNLLSGDADNDEQLDVNEVWTFEAVRTVTQQEIDARIDLVSMAAVDSDQTKISAAIARAKIRVPDFDANRQVDGHDFLRWQRGFGKTANATQADGNADDDQDVDRDDLDPWEVLFGAPAPPRASGVLTAAVVLEPSLVETPTRGVRQRYTAPARRELVDLALEDFGSGFRQLTLQMQHQRLTVWDDDANDESGDDQTLDATETSKLENVALDAIAHEYRHSIKV
jgi:hypothetical protein